MSSTENRSSGRTIATAGRTSAERLDEEEAEAPLVGGFVGALGMADRSNLAEST